MSMTMTMTDIVSTKVLWGLPSHGLCDSETVMSPMVGYGWRIKPESPDSVLHV